MKLKEFVEMVNVYYHAHPQLAECRVECPDATFSYDADALIGIPLIITGTDEDDRPDNIRIQIFDKDSALEEYQYQTRLRNQRVKK